MSRTWMPVLIEISLSRVIFWRPYFSTTWSTLSLQQETFPDILITDGHTRRRCRKRAVTCASRRPTRNLPLDGEVVVALGLRGDVLPQLVGRQAGPRRVVTAAGDPVAALAAFAP